jgi:hypothetical protein
MPRPFRTVVRDLGLTPNQVWGLTKTDGQWSAELEAALTATRRGDLQHGTNAAYVAGCVCKDCRDHQRRRMAKNTAKRASPVVRAHVSARWRAWDGDVLLTSIVGNLAGPDK